MTAPRPLTFYVDIWAKAPNHHITKCVRVWDDLELARTTWDRLQRDGWEMVSPRP